MNDAGGTPEEQATDIALLRYEIQTLTKSIDALTDNLGTYMKITGRLQIYQAESETRWELHGETHKDLKLARRIETMIGSSLAALVGFVTGQQ